MRVLEDRGRGRPVCRDLLRSCPLRGRPIFNARQQAPQPLLQVIPVFRLQPMLQSRITRHFRQQAVAGGDLCQMHLRLKTDSFEGLQLLRQERVVEVFGHGVGIFRKSSAVRLGGADRGPADSGPNPLHELRGKCTGSDLRAELLLFVPRQHSIEPGQEGSEGKSHGHAPVGVARSVWALVISMRRGLLRIKSVVLPEFSCTNRENFCDPGENPPALGGRRPFRAGAP